MGKDSANNNGFKPRPVWVYPLVSIFVWAVALVLLFHFFSAFKIILLGLLAAVSVAALLRPVSQRIPGPRGLSAAVVGLGFLLVVAAIVAVMVWLLMEPIGQQLSHWPEIRDGLNHVLADWGRALGVHQAVTVDNLGNQLIGFIGGQSVGEVVGRTTDLTTVILLSMIFVFAGSMYILAEPPGKLVRPVLKMLPPARVVPMQAAIKELEPRLRWWLLGTFISMVVMGVGSFVGYTIIGLQWALALGVVAGVLEAVPTVGPLTTFMLSLLIAATQGFGQVIGVTVVYAIVQTIESYVLIPLVMKKAVDIPPVVTLFTIVLWGKIFGIAGLLLAIPIDLVLWSVIDHFVIRPHDVE